MDDSDAVPLLHGGPFDGEFFPYNPESGDFPSVFERQADVGGEWVMARYERTDDGAYEYAGAKSIAYIATEATQPAPSEEEELVDLDSMTSAEALAFLQEDNERRITELLENTGGQVDLSEAFDARFLRIFVNRILLFMSPMIHEEASLEFENARSRKLDELQDKYEEMYAQREAALAQARLSMQGPPPGMGAQGGAGGAVTMPNRRIRRGG
jgi:hypothetical protein